MRGDFVYDHSNWDPGIWQSGTGRGMCSGEGAGYGTAAVFTRRDPAQVKIATANVPVVNVKDMADWKNSIDVLILCGGSATDLPVQTPEMARMFNVIDSFDTHARIPEHFAAVDEAARASGHLGIISVAGIPACFPWPGCTATPSCLRERITPSGAKGSARATATPSAGFPVSKTPSSIRCRWKQPWKRCAAEASRN